MSTNYSRYKHNNSYRRGGRSYGTSYRRNNNSQKTKNRSLTDGTEWISMPASFARALMRQIVYDPKNTLGVKVNNYTLFDKDEILGWLQTPSTNEQNLRNASNYLYIASSHYRRLIAYYAGLYTGSYIILPVGFNPTTVADKKENYKKNFYKTAKILEALNIPQLMYNIFLVAEREGAYYGVVWADNTSAFIQRIDADYCKITSICDGTFLYSVDMSRLAGRLEYYPDVFTTMYQNYLVTGQKWQEVPMELSICIKADSTILDSSIPIFAATMPQLYTIANTEALQETATELKNYKMIAGDIPVDDKGRPLMSEDIVEKYYGHISNSLGENVGLALSPFKLYSLSFDDNRGVADVDDLAKAVGNFWSTAGTSGLLHGVENSTSGVTKLAIKNDETYVLDLVHQFERVINRYLKTATTGTSKFKIVILPITIYNREEYIEYYKTAASLGIGKSYYAAALGISQLDFCGNEFTEELIMPYKNLTPLKSTYNTSDTASTGRPSLSAEDLSDSGEATRDNDTNANR